MRNRTPKMLGKLERRLLAYAAAATAAGVSSLALSPSAEAKIVYTPAHVKIPRPTRFSSAQVFLDLNHDGLDDFFLSNFFGGSAPNSYAFLNARPDKFGNRVLEKNGVASALPAGVRVGFNNTSSNGFMAGFRTEAGHSTGFAGPWANEGKGVRNRYLGLRFIIKGQVHFSWARLNVSFKNGAFSGLLTGYAYETIPNKAIITGKTKGKDQISATDANAAVESPVPQPASLGALAQGASGVVAWRRTQSEGTAK